MRARTISAVLVSLIPAALVTTPALADPGGATAPSATPTAPASAGGATPTSATTTKPHVPAHASPITARSSNIAYHGPVYERTATGQVVPYAPATAAAATPTGGSEAGLLTPSKPELLVPGSLARYVNGVAAAPMSAPPVVQEIIWAGDEIIGLPYIYGGGHASFSSPGYDCSGTVSFALHGGKLLETPEDSSEFIGWGSACLLYTSDAADE